MGEYGNFLQRAFGGTRHDVSTWKTVKKTEEELILDKKIEEDRDFLDFIKREHFYNKFDYSAIVKEDFITEKVWEEFVNWKTPYKIS